MLSKILGPLQGQGERFTFRGVKEGYAYHDHREVLSSATARYPEEQHGSEFRLMRSTTGGRVPMGYLEEDGQSVPWSVGKYLTSIGKSSSQIKFGLYRVDDRETSESGVHSSSSSHLCSATASSIATTSESGVHSSSPSHLYSATASSIATVSHAANNLEVLYSPSLGATGLDLDIQLTRSEVYEKEAPGSISLSESDRNIGVFSPEEHLYHLSSIKRGEEELLSLSDHGWKVLDDDGRESWIVHQSESEIILPEDKSALPLYAIASGHRNSLDYTWYNSEEEIGFSSPVVWINEPETYKCVVENIIRNIHCRSTLIIVKNRGTGESAKAAGSGEREIRSRSEPHMEGSGTTASRSTTAVDSITADVMEFPHTMLMSGTDNFSSVNAIGEGGFGKVFRGRVYHCDVAIKLLSDSGVKALRAQPDRQLSTEVKALTRFRHPNLMTLMGYCSSPPALVYPFMVRMSLFTNLHKFKVVPLSWRQRSSILRDTANGLAFLHAGNLVHHDVNSSNILLDENYNAKVSDFGFCVQLDTSSDKTIFTAIPGEGMPGTRGYIAPECCDGKFSMKSDVYSYGIVCLETFSGLLAYSTEREDCKLIEHCSNGISDLSRFGVFADKKAGVCPRTEMEMIHLIVCRSTDKHSKRAVMEEVLEIWNQAACMHAVGPPPLLPSSDIEKTELYFS